MSSMKTRSNTPPPQAEQEAKEKCSSYQRVNDYRKRLKEDPDKWEKVKERDRLRKQAERKENRKRAQKDKKFADKLKESKKLQMQKYREKHTAHRANVPADSLKRSQAGTRNAKKQQARSKTQRQKELKKEQEKLKQLKKKKEVLRVQKWRLRVKLTDRERQDAEKVMTAIPSTSTVPSANTHADAGEHPQRLVIACPANTSLEMENRTLDQAPNSTEDESDGFSPAVNEGNKGPFSSYWKERRAVKKTKQQLPATPAKRARVVQKLMSSPRTSKYLQHQSSAEHPAARRKLLAGEALVDAMEKSLTETKHAGTAKKDKARAYRQLKHLACSSITLRRYFKLKKKKMSLPGWWKDAKRKKRKDRIPDDVRALVREFYLSPDTSRPVPNVREVMWVLDEETGQKRKVQKHVMLMTLAEAFKEFKRQYPEVKVGFSTFKSLKPMHVKKVSETSRRTCLCTICCNVALKVEAVRKVVSACKEDGEPAGDPFVNITKQSVAAVTLCPCDQDPKSKCLNRDCDDCGTDRLSAFFQPLITKSEDDPVTWHKWEYITLRKKDGEKRCMSCVPHTTSLTDLVKDLATNLEQYPGHVFRASWQHSQMTECLKQLKDGEVVTVMDFSENYNCRFKNEVQTAFFDQNQVTLHPMMCYYLVKHKGEDVRMKHSINGISDDLKHDTCLVRKFQEQALTVLQKTTQIRQIYEWTDGCAAQYKAKAAFADISLQAIPVERGFFETSHGKNVCDGLGAVVKNVCYQAVVTGKAVLGTAEDVFAYCQANLAHATREVVRCGKMELSIRDFIYVSASDTSHERAELQVQTLAGTRKLHSIKNMPGRHYVVKVRNLACFCTGCEKEETCDNQEYVEPWKTYELKKAKKVVAAAAAQVTEDGPDHNADNGNGNGILPGLNVVSNTLGEILCAVNW